MIDTEWTKYAFTIPETGELGSITSSRAVPCEVTIDKDGNTFVALDTACQLRGGPTCLSKEQLRTLSSKVKQLRLDHNEG